MQSSIRLIIRKAKQQKDGKHVVYLQYCFTSSKRVLISTGIAIPFMYWDPNTSSIMQSLPEEHGQAASLQKALNQQQAKAEKIVKYVLKRNDTCPMQFLKRNFRLPDCWDLEQLEDESNQLDVFYQINR